MFKRLKSIEKIKEPQNSFTIFYIYISPLQKVLFIILVRGEEIKRSKIIKKEIEKRSFPGGVHRVCEPELWCDKISLEIFSRNRNSVQTGCRFLSLWRRISEFRPLHHQTWVWLLQFLICIYECLAVVSQNINMFNEGGICRQPKGKYKKIIRLVSSEFKTK